MDFKVVLVPLAIAILGIVVNAIINTNIKVCPCKETAYSGLLKRMKKAPQLSESARLRYYPFGPSSVKLGLNPASSRTRREGYPPTQLQPPARP